MIASITPRPGSQCCSKAAVRPEVIHEGVGDRAYDSACTVAKLGVEDVLQSHYGRRSAVDRLLVHAVVSGNCHDSAHLFELSKACIHFRVEAVGLGIARCIGLLDEIGARDVRGVGEAFLEKREIRGANVRKRLTDVWDILNSVLIHHAVVGVLGGKADGAVGELPTLLELMTGLALGRDRGYPCAVARESTHHQVDLQQFGPGQDHGFVFARSR